MTFILDYNIRHTPSQNKLRALEEYLVIRTAALEREEPGSLYVLGF